jgi:hypothetical protein
MPRLMTRKRAAKCCGLACCSHRQPQRAAVPFDQVAGVVVDFVGIRQFEIEEALLRLGEQRAGVS